MYTLTKKGSINTDGGIVRKNDVIRDEDYNALSKRQKAFFVKFTEPPKPVDEIKELEKTIAGLKKKVEDLQKTNSGQQRKVESLKKELSELKGKAKSE